MTVTENDRQAKRFVYWAVFDHQYEGVLNFKFDHEEHWSEWLNRALEEIPELRVEYARWKVLGTPAPVNYSL